MIKLSTFNNQHFLLRIYQESAISWQLESFLGCPHRLYSKMPIITYFNGDLVLLYLFVFNRSRSFLQFLRKYYR